MQNLTLHYHLGLAIIIIMMTALIVHQYHYTIKEKTLIVLKISVLAYMVFYATAYFIADENKSLEQLTPKTEQYTHKDHQLNIHSFANSYQTSNILIDLLASSIDNDQATIQIKNRNNDHESIFYDVPITEFNLILKHSDETKYKPVKIEMDAITKLRKSKQSSELTIYVDRKEHIIHTSLDIPLSEIEVEWQLKETMNDKQKPAYIAITPNKRIHLDYSAEQTFEIEMIATGPSTDAAIETYQQGWK